MLGLLAGAVLLVAGACSLKGLFVRECAEGSRCSRKTLCVCVCVCGEMYLLLVRGVSRSKTLIPLILVTIRLDAFYYNNK